MKAIGLVEFVSIAKGIEAADAMLKASRWSFWTLDPFVPENILY